MVASYNGFKASKNPADFGGLDNSFIPGTSAKLAPGVRAGDVATIAFDFCAEFDKRVEDIDAFAGGDEWGYYFKQSANSKALLSCHSSGTAWDLNATRHPNGKRGTFTGAQVAEIRKLLAEYDGVIYWGGDCWGNGTPDEMHWEIETGTELTQLAEVAAKVRAKANAPKASTPAPATPWYKGDLGSRVLQNGSQGTDVARLQSILNKDYGLYSNLHADGIFGPATEAVVREFQKRAKLAVDGVVGPATLKKLGI